MNAVKRLFATAVAALALFIALLGISTPANAQTTYDGQAAAQFALRYATDKQPPQFAGCTWFASNALWMGGLPESTEWNPHGLKGKVFKTPGTLAATAAPELAHYLVSSGLATELDLEEELSTNAVPEARPGDLIAYDWDTSEGFSYDHFAVVVNIASGSYPEVAEWGTSSWPDRTIDYSKRGWTWSANSNNWLENSFPNISAKLFQIGR